MKKQLLALVLACLTMGLKADQFTLEHVQLIAQDITALLTAQDSKVPTNLTNDITNFALEVTQFNDSLDEDLLRDFLKETLASYGIVDETIINQAIENCKQNQKAAQINSDEEFAKALEAEQTTTDMKPANNNVEIDDPELELAIAENLEAQRDPALEKAITQYKQIKQGIKLLQELDPQITKPSAPQDTTHSIAESATESAEPTKCVICQDTEYVQGDQPFKLSCGCVLGHAACIKEWFKVFANGTNEYEQDLETSVLTLPFTGSIELKCPLCNAEIEPVDQVRMSQL